jgi:hypothetical protein
VPIAWHYFLNPRSDSGSDAGGLWPIRRGTSWYRAEITADLGVAVRLEPAEAVRELARGRIVFLADGPDIHDTLFAIKRREFILDELADVNERQDAGMLAGAVRRGAANRHRGTPENRFKLRSIASVYSRLERGTA